MPTAILSILFFLSALLYSSVGHGGASGYLAVMGIVGVEPAMMKPTALCLNILVSAIAFWAILCHGCLLFPHLGCLGGGDNYSDSGGFFTPTRQIGHCGHATIAAFCRMRELGILKDGKMSKETIDGTREIILDNGMAYMEQKAPSYFNIEDDDTLNKIAASIGSNAEDAQLNCIVNTGNSFLLVHLPNQQSLSNLKPNQNSINEISEQYDLIGYYAFTKETSISGRDASARMFAPRFGIAEESATGTAAGPLTCYLHDILNIKKNKFLIEQGILGTRPR